MMFIFQRHRNVVASGPAYITAETRGRVRKAGVPYSSKWPRNVSHACTSCAERKLNALSQPHKARRSRRSPAFMQRARINDTEQGVNFINTAEKFGQIYMPGLS